jgi:TRAP-type C4-dicarboxylate transport system permease small subunit
VNPNAGSGSPPAATNKPDAPITSALARLAITIAAVALCLMALAQGWQVFARYVLNDSPSWTEPTSLLLMNTAMMFGAAVGVKAGAHFGFFLLPQAARGLWRKALLACTHLLVAALSGLLSIWAARLVVDAWPVTIAGAPLPQGLNFLPLAIGGALMVVFSIEHLLRTVRTSSDGL